jgi:aminoglycoside phosphotransferase (APT) family kinase protein
MRTFSRSSGLNEAELLELEEFCRERQGVFYPKTDFDPKEKLSAPRFNPELAKVLDEEAVRAVCERVFSRSLHSVEALKSQGTFHSLFRVSLSARESYILKARGRGHGGRHAFEFLIDGWVSETLGAQGVPVVSFHTLSFSEKLAPFDFEILGEAEGVPLREFEDAATQYVEPRLLGALGEAVARVHSIETEGFGPLDIRSILPGATASRAGGLHGAWSDYILLNLDEHIDACLEIEAVSPQESERIRNCFERAGAFILETAPSRLLHGDLGHHNVFSDGERITAIIDWEDCLCGDPVFDLAYWGTFCRDYMREHLLEGYNRAAQRGSDFERRYWLYYLRVALSKTVHRHRFGYADRPNRPPASRRIQKALDRLEEVGLS